MNQHGVTRGLRVSGADHLQLHGVTLRALRPVAVPAGPAVRRLLPALAAALAGDGPALLPHPDGEPPPASLRPGDPLEPGEDDAADPTVARGGHVRLHRGPEGCPAARLRAARLGRGDPRPARRSRAVAARAARRARGGDPGAGAVPGRRDRAGGAGPVRRVPGRPLRRRRADHLRAAPLHRPGADPAHQAAGAAVRTRSRRWPASTPSWSAGRPPRHGCASGPRRPGSGWSPRTG